MKNFECKASCEGKCCKAPKDREGFIYLTKQDANLLTLHTGLALSGIAEERTLDSTRFTDKPTKQLVLRKAANGDCAFLKENQCSIYKARPTQCRTFPYWPETLTRNNWQDLGKFCPGIGHGTDSKMAAMFKLQTEADLELIDGI